MPRRRAAKVDSNHGEVRDTYRKAGAVVADTSGAGSGFPDMVVSYRGQVHLVEVKDGSKPPSARKLTPDQVKFHAEQASVGVTVHVVTCVDDALIAIGARKGK
jgi:hypothetical protein